ncbi:MAG: adenine deaminase C-terminal domain-containing protein, partial [Desulfobacterales bacterium]|nr:adenine deaminase C-terminal domain-containing protein [Desulfobacterales bacterium]
SGEILQGYSVAVKGEKIAFLGKDCRHTVGPDTQVIDAAGKVLIPGLIDSHTHMDFPVVMPHNYVGEAILSGTTTIITETVELANVLGRGCYPAILHFLASLKDLPIKFFATAPSLIPVLPEIEEGTPFTPEELAGLLKNEQILGLGESNWISVLDENEAALDMLEKCRQTGKRLEGHGAGARGAKLAAYAACGISSDHEALSAEDVLERLRLGMHVMIREGSVRRDLESISRIRKSITDCRRLILVTDGLKPEDLMEYGYMTHLVQKAIDLGFDPVTAIQMATINPAEYFRLDHRCGGIAPGRDADMLLIPDLRTIKCELVVSKGRVVARNGNLLVQACKYEPLEMEMNSMHVSKTFEAPDFNVLLEDGMGAGLFRVIHLVTDVITEQLLAQLPVKNKQVQADPGKDIIKISVIDRHRGSHRSFTGFVKGFGMRAGAVACSYSWEARSPMVVVGAREADMATAVNRVVQLGGGLAVCNAGQILAEISLPIGGFLATCSVREAADRFDRIGKALKDLGCLLPNPYLTLMTSAGTFLPFFRITQSGLVDIRKKKIVGLVKARAAGRT